MHCIITRVKAKLNYGGKLLILLWLQLFADTVSLKRMMH